MSIVERLLANPNRFEQFTDRELMWMTLSLAWARTDTAERDDDVLLYLFAEACKCIARRHDEREVVVAS